MEIDFVLIKDRTMVKTFAITNQDGTAHNMSTSVVRMTVYKPTPIILVATIGGVNSEQASFVFDATVNANLGDYEYEIMEDPITGPDISLGRGNIMWSLATDFTTQIYTLIDGETLPFGIKVDSNYKTQSVTYWKYYLQPQFDVLEADLELDTAWPVLVRFLIAKLVVHDFIVLQMKSSLNTAFSSNTSGGGSGAPGYLKKLETGPANAEWYDGGTSISNMMKAGANGKTPFDEFKTDVCQLAHRVRALIPMCGQLDYSPIVPIKAERPALVDPELILIDYYG